MASTVAILKTQRSIGNITAYVLIEESTTDELEITSHPVQNGAPITDHAFKQPAELSLKILCGQNEKPLDQIYSDFLILQASREPFQITTPKRIYKNMLMQSVGQTTDKETENVLSLSLKCREIIMVSTQTVKVPPRKVHKKPNETGGTEKTGEKTPVEESNLSQMASIF